MTVKGYISYIVASTIALLTFSTGCRRAPGNVTEEGEILNLSEFTDTVYAPEYAEGFIIMSAPGRESLLLTVNNPWQGAQGVVSQLLMLRGGEEAPQDFSGATVNSVAARMVAMSTTNVAMLDRLNALYKVVAVSGKRFLTTPRLPDVADAGNEADADYEAIVTASPDLALIYGVATASVMESQLKRLKIPYLYIADYLEQNPLGRAEWIVALGYISGEEKTAKEHFAEIAGRYNELKESVETSSDGRPRVMLNAPYNDAWFLPDAGNYMVNLIRDAGGEYVFEQNTSGRSEAIGDEKAMMLASESDVWLCPGQFISIEALATALPRYSDVPAVKSRRVWNNNLRVNSTGGNDFYESGAVYPDRILEDLIEILNPSDHDYQPYYFRQLR